MYSKEFIDNIKIQYEIEDVDEDELSYICNKLSYLIVKYRLKPSMTIVKTGLMNCLRNNVGWLLTIDGISISISVLKYDDFRQGDFKELRDISLLKLLDGKHMPCISGSKGYFAYLFPYKANPLMLGVADPITGNIIKFNPTIDSLLVHRRVISITRINNIPDKIKNRDWYIINVAPFVVDVPDEPSPSKSLYTDEDDVLTLETD